MGNPVLAGARVVALDAAVFPIHIADADVGLAYNLLTGPAIRAITDPPYKAYDFTPSGEGLQWFAPDLYLNVNRRSILTPYRHPNLTPFARWVSGSEPTQLIK